MGNDLIPHQQPFSYRRPPLPSTTLSLINCPSPIDDPLSLQRPSSLITNPSPINDLILYQPPPLLSTTSSLINNPFSHQPLLASTTSSIYQSLPHQHDNPYEEHTPPGFSHSTSCGKSYIRFSF